MSTRIRIFPSNVEIQDVVITRDIPTIKSIYEVEDTATNDIQESTDNKKEKKKEVKKITEVEKKEE